MTTALAIDVGSEGHGWCLGELRKGEKPEVLGAGWIAHVDLVHKLVHKLAWASHKWGAALAALAALARPQLVILEEFHHLGKPIFKDGALTLRNSGFLAGALAAKAPGVEVLTVTFPDIARWLYLSGATEAAVQRVVIESYPATGGGSTPQIGTQAQPGPLYALRAASKTYPEEVKTRNHHKAALAALCYGSAVWAAEVKG